MNDNPTVWDVVASIPREYRTASRVVGALGIDADMTVASLRQLVDWFNAYDALGVPDETRRDA